MNIFEMDFGLFVFEYFIEIIVGVIFVLFFMWFIVKVVVFCFEKFYEECIEMI